MGLVEVGDFDMSELVARQIVVTRPRGGSTVDVALIGGGILSATLAVLLRHLEPKWSVVIFERLEQIGSEASAALHNAGTGHAGLCEMHYTPRSTRGSVSIDRAVAVNEQFLLSRQLWSGLVRCGRLTKPADFINSVPHMSVVFEEDGIALLRQRFAAMSRHHLFDAMRFSENRAAISDWLPLVTAGREQSMRVAATWDPTGCDVDFGSLTRQLLEGLSGTAQVHTAHEVRRPCRNDDGTWRLLVRDRRRDITAAVHAKFVFVGAGGWALKLLQQAGIPEARGYGLIPIGGCFLRCDEPAVVNGHHAKAYGAAPLGAPPIAMPHLDTRISDGKRWVQFGPYPAPSPRFLSNGTVLDFPSSVRPHNVRPLIMAAKQNLGLARLLLAESVATQAGRMEQLRQFVPDAVEHDWSLVRGGQRAQIVKRDRRRGGYLQFGTEIVAAEDGTLAAVLGASPGASTAAAIVLSVLSRCFPGRYAGWAPRLRELIPSLGTSLADNPVLARKVLCDSAEALGLVSP
ncbi:malate dehydrogenase (quinone) [Nocardia brasiliensis]